MDVDSLIDSEWDAGNPLTDVSYGLPEVNTAPMEQPQFDVGGLIDSAWDTPAEDNYSIGDALVTAGRRFIPTIQRTIGGMGELASGAMEYAGKGISALEDVQRKGMNLVGLDFPSDETFGSDVTEFAQEAGDIDKKITGAATRLLQQPEYNLPPKLRQHIIDNPSLAIDPRWLIVNGGDAVASMGPALVAAWVGGPAIGGMAGGAMEAGGAYDEMLRTGVSKDKALTAATAYGITSGFLNELGFDEMLTNRQSLSLMQKLAGYGRTAAVEGTTEGAEEPFQAVYQAVAAGKKMPEIYKDFKESLKNSLDVMVSAGVVAPVGGAASDIVNTVAGDPESTSVQKDSLADSVPVDVIIDEAWGSEINTPQEHVPGFDVFKGKTMPQESEAGPPQPAVQPPTATEDGRGYEDYIDSLINEIDSYHKPVKKKSLTEQLPDKGWRTPVIKGEENLAALQGNGLPIGTFIALDKPFRSDAHDASQAQEVEVPQGLVIYDPDGVIGLPSKKIDIAKELGKYSQLDTRQAYAKVLRDIGYDAYVRGIDGDKTNRELIILDKEAPQNEEETIKTIEPAQTTGTEGLDSGSEEQQKVDQSEENPHGLVTPIENIPVDMEVMTSVVGEESGRQAIAPVKAKEAVKALGDLIEKLNKILDCVKS